MPTFFTKFGWRFFAYDYDLIGEPFHVHVIGHKKTCKYWMYEDGSVELSQNLGFTRKELKRIEDTIAEQVKDIQEDYEHFCEGNGYTVNYKTSRKT